jgi:parallel beta-helix repeat protein
MQSSMVRPAPWAALLGAAFVVCLAGCQAKAPTGAGRDLSRADTAYQTQLVNALIDAKPGDVIEIPEGVFVIDTPLSLNVDNVTIRGKGMDKSILNFRNQASGAQGLLVTADNFTIENLAIEDALGDGLKINESQNVVIRALRTEWTGGPKTENGAYGIYPVQSRNVLIEDSVAIGASDAGIYVGQSVNVVVRRNRAEYNVAGIEIENTIAADVYENVATNNTGGILVFNMPQLQQPGHQTRVYNNRVFANNTANFGHKGTPVASVPAGTGVIVNSNDKVEIFDNEIADNKTGNIIISSLFSAGYSDSAMSESFDPYPESILISGNRFSGGGDAPDGVDLQALRVAKFGPTGHFPDIVWDGYVNPALLVRGQLPENLRICIDNGEAGILNVDGPNHYAAPNTDIAPHRCSLPRLPAVTLPAA